MFPPVFSPDHMGNYINPDAAQWGVCLLFSLRRRTAQAWLASLLLLRLSAGRQGVYVWLCVCVCVCSSTIINHTVDFFLTSGGHIKRLPNQDVSCNLAHLQQENRHADIIHSSSKPCPVTGCHGPTFCLRKRRGGTPRGIWLLICLQGCRGRIWLSVRVICRWNPSCVVWAKWPKLYWTWRIRVNSQCLQPAGGWDPKTQHSMIQWQQNGKKLQ